MSDQHAESFDQAGFKEFSRNEGRAEITLMGETQGIDYRSVNYLNSRATVAYAEIEAEGDKNTMFISMTSSGAVFSFPSQQPGPVPFPMEGYHAVMGVSEDATPEETYAVHLKGLEGADLLSDEAWLKAQTPVLPQRALEVMNKFFETLSQAGGAMEQALGAVGQAVAEGFQELASALGEEEEEESDGLDFYGDNPDYGRICRSCGEVRKKGDKICSLCGEELTDPYTGD